MSIISAKNILTFHWFIKFKYHNKCSIHKLTNRPFSITPLQDSKKNKSIYCWDTPIFQSIFLVTSIILKAKIRTIWKSNLIKKLEKDIEKFVLFAKNYEETFKNHQNDMNRFE